MWLENFGNFLYNIGNKLQGIDNETAKKGNGNNASLPKSTYTCKDTEHLAPNFKFNVGRDCAPGNRLYFTDHNSKYEILSDISSMNNYISQARSIGNIRKKYEICVDEISFTGENASYIEVCPYTPSGKDAKFPIVVHYFTPNYSKSDPADNYFGDIFYFKDGTIGKAKLVNWIGKTMLSVELKTIGRELVISKITTCDAKGQQKEIYNSNKKK